jgi:very-short-patch-repair endonuclease
MPLPKNSNLTPYSRKLRKAMTKQEIHLWFDCLKKLPVTVNRQKVILRYIVDFYCDAVKLVIEIDGGQHYEDIGFANDVERDSCLRDLGLEVIRFTNQEVNHNFFNICRAIETVISERSQINCST